MTETVSTDWLKSPSKLVGEQSLDYPLPPLSGLLSDLCGGRESYESMMSDLRETGGIRFLEKKRHASLPVNIDFSGVIAPRQIESCNVSIGELRKYLNGECIIDRFGSDHDERRRWREEKRIQFGPPFVILIDLNQLRGNSITKVCGRMDLLSRSLRINGHSTQANTLREISSKYIDRMTGEDHLDNERYNLLPLEDKLKLVRELGENIVEILNMVNTLCPNKSSLQEIEIT